MPRAAVEGQGLRIGYFAQHQLEQLHATQNALQHIRNLDPQASEQEIRSFLGGFGFAGDDALRLVAPFSGGEKARLVLALLAWQRPHLLLLDEPTNHLDLDMRDALTLALQEYQGAVVVVSHDRHLLRTLADRLVLVADGRVTAFDGDLEDYRIWLNQAQNQVPAKAVAPGVNARAQARQLAQQRRPLEKRLADIEKQLGRLHEEKTTLEALLADPASYQAEHATRLKEGIAKQARVVEQLQQIEEAWLEVSEALASPDSVDTPRTVA